MTLPKKFLVLVCDLVIAALVLGSIWGVNYLVPQKGVRAQVMSGTAYGETAETDNTAQAQTNRAQAGQIQAQEGVESDAAIQEAEKRSRL